MKATLFLILALFAVSIMASKEAVLHLTAGDFDEKVSDGKVYFVKFFAPWCGHCKRLVPTWAELAEKSKGDTNVVVASVDCTQHKTVCDAAEIKGFPTLKIYHGGAAKTQYSGSRTLEDLKAFIDGQRRLLLEETTS